MSALAASLLTLAAAAPVHVMTVEVRFDPPAAVAAALTPEMLALRDRPHLVSRVHVSGEFSRQEVVSTDFMLPAGTFVLHRAGTNAYVVGDPATRTFIETDANGLLEAIEGGAGIRPEGYAAQVAHSQETKTIAGKACRKSTVTVTYQTPIPFESGRVMMPHTNEIEVWHTTEIASPSALEPFFLKFRRAEAQSVERVLTKELGFPLEVRLTAIHGRGAKRTPSGTIRMLVTELKTEANADPDLFRMPPRGYTKSDKPLPLKPGALSGAATGESK